MLDILEQALGPEETELRSLIQGTKSRFVQERGPEIRAGINLAEEVNARATTPQEMQELRDLYRGEVIGFKNPQDCFRSLLSSRGAGGIADAIQFLIAGCGADIKAATPSRDAEALGRILTDLNCVQVLQTVLEKLDQLAARMPKQFGDVCLMNGEQMAGRVLDFTEQPFVSSATIAAFVGECGMAKLLAKMDFTRELTRLFRQLSPRLFAKEGDRQRLVDVTQEHLDDLITQENEEEEDKESVA
jgi:type III secretion protein W